MDLSKLSDAVEKVSKKYAGKFKIQTDPDWFVLKLQEELGELIQTYLMMIGKARKKGQSDAKIRDNFEKEVADVFCHVLLLAKKNKVDLEKVVAEKWLRWNK